MSASSDIGGIVQVACPYSRARTSANNSPFKTGFRAGPCVVTTSLQTKFANTSRLPTERRVDLDAQIAANARGETLLKKLFHAESEGSTTALNSGLLDHATTYFRHWLRRQEWVTTVGKVNSKAMD